jgi:hypothetical protein
LGKFNLPVTITPTSNTIFFIDPTNGNDAFPGTAAKPWKLVKSVLDITQPPGLKVATVATAGNDVVVTILAADTENVGVSINTPALPAGSVTVLQAPFPKTFELDMTATTAQLTLNQGYKLQDIKITSAFAGSGTPPQPAAVTINHPTAGLASVDVKCTGATVTCVQVKGAGSHTLKDVKVDVTDTTADNIGILNNDANVNLSIVGGEVRLTGNNQAIILIDSKGVLIATGLTVDMTNSGGTAHTQNSRGIILRAPGSFITGSTIKMNRGASSGDAIGIKVQGSASKSTVEGNTFIGFNVGGGNLIGVNGNANLFSDALLKNTFNGFFTPQPVQ